MPASRAASARVMPSSALAIASVRRASRGPPRAPQAGAAPPPARRRGSASPSLPSRPPLRVGQDRNQNLPPRLNSRPSQNLSRTVSDPRSEEHTSELQSRQYIVCRLLLEKKNT